MSLVFVLLVSFLVYSCSFSVAAEPLASLGNGSNSTYTWQASTHESSSTSSSSAGIAQYIAQGLGSSSLKTTSHASLSESGPIAQYVAQGLGGGASSTTAKNATVSSSQSGSLDTHGFPTASVTDSMHLFPTHLSAGLTRPPMTGNSSNVLTTRPVPITSTGNSSVNSTDEVGVYMSAWSCLNASHPAAPR